MKLHMGKFEEAAANYKLLPDVGMTKHCYLKLIDQKPNSANLKIDYAKYLAEVFYVDLAINYFLEARDIICRDEEPDKALLNEIHQEIAKVKEGKSS